MKIQISLFLFLVLFSTLYIGNAHAQSFSGGFSAYNPDPPFDLYTPPMGPVLSQTGTAPGYSPDFDPLQFHYETIYGVPILIQSGTIKYQDPILIRDPDGPASDILPPVTEAPEWIPHESASDPSTYLPVIPQVTPLPEGTSIESVIDSALDENAPEWVDPLTVRPESPQVTQPGPQIVIPNPYFVDSSMPVEQLNSKLEIILELIDSDLTPEGAFVSPPGVGEDGKMEYVDPLDMRSVPRLGVPPYISPTPTTESNIEILQIATPIDGYSGKKIDQPKDTISVPSTDPIKTKRFIEFITDYANELIQEPRSVKWEIQKVEDKSNIITTTDNIGFVIISLINKQADLKKTLDGDRVLTPLQKNELKSINNTMEKLLESLELLEYDIMKEKKEDKKKHKKIEPKQSNNIPHLKFDILKMEHDNSLVQTGDPLVFTLDGSEVCVKKREMGSHDGSYWAVNIYGTTPPIMINMEREICDTTYMFGVENNNNGIIDTAFEMLWFEDWSAFKFIMNMDYYHGNFDGYFDADDPRWSDAIIMDANRNTYTPEELGIESVRYIDNIVEYPNDRYGLGVYADERYVSENRFRIVAWSPDAITLTDGTSVESYGMVQGALQDCTIHDIRYHEAELMTADYLRVDNPEDSTGLYERALDYCDDFEAANQNPDKYLSHWIAGIASMEHKKGFTDKSHYIIAEKRYEEALAMSPDNPFYNVDYCLLQFHMGDSTSECIPVMDKAIIDRPDVEWFGEARIIAEKAS